MDALYTRNVTVLPSQVDAWGRMSAAATFDLFMDTATQAAGALGVGWDFLMQQGLFWITVKTRIRFFRPPRLLESLQVATWPERPVDMRCNRHYELLKGNEVLVRGKTEWAIVDVRTRKPRPLKGILPEDLVYPEAPGGDTPFPMIEGPFPDPPFAEHRVSAGDIDMARHMNNVAYIRAIVNAFPLNAWKAMDVRQIDVIFLDSAHEGDVLAFRRRQHDHCLDICGARAGGSVSVLARLETGNPSAGQ